MTDVSIDPNYFYADSETQTLKEKRSSIQNPPHYNKHPSGIECIQITRHMNFNLGNAVKYIWRADLKNDAIEDLKKAAWYIQDEIQKGGLLVKYTNTKGFTIDVPNPWIKVKSTSWEVIKHLSQQFGLTPVSRNKLEVPESNEPDELDLILSGD